MTDLDLGELRPLIAGTYRREGDAVVVAVGRRDVRVTGDLGVVEALLGRCDGRRIAQEVVGEAAPGDVAAASELLLELVRQGAVVDATQAYRIVHEQGSVGSPFFPDLDAAAVRALEAERFSPPEVGDGSVALAPKETALGGLAARRRSAEPAMAPRPVGFDELSAVLRAAYGGAGPRGRAVPSAGALYPLLVHVWAREPTGPLAPGLWWYDTADDRLREIPGPPARPGDLFLPHPLSDRLLERRHPVVFVSADLARASRKYGNRGYRYALMEAGGVMQAASLAGTELGMPVRAVGGIHDARVRDFLNLPEGAEPLLALLLGA